MSEADAAVTQNILQFPNNKEDAVVDGIQSRCK
jgi:hypothetical protein